MAWFGLRNRALPPRLSYSWLKPRERSHRTEIPQGVLTGRASPLKAHSTSWWLCCDSTRRTVYLEWGHLEEPKAKRVRAVSSPFSPTPLLKHNEKTHCPMERRNTVKTKVKAVVFLKKYSFRAPKCFMESVQIELTSVSQHNHPPMPLHEKTRFSSFSPFPS